MSSHRYAVLIGAACVACATATAAHAQGSLPSGALTLEDAFERALADAPALQASDAALRAASAAVRQADRALNPTIDVQIENGLGSGYYSGLQRSESTLSFSQTIERGGDRAARTQLSVRQGERAKAHGEAARQDLLMEVEAAYVDAQRAASERLVADERLRIAREVAVTVQRRVDAARDPLLASSRSLTQQVESEIGAENARLAELAAKERLASFWSGAGAFDVEVISFDLTKASASPDALGSPELAAARAAEAEAHARIDVERARSKLDPTVSAGVRYFADDREAAFVVGVSIPLGVNDDNSAAVERASAESQRAHFETEALRRNIERQVATARSQIEVAISEIASLDDRLLPAAEQAVERARQGYAQGGFTYLDVLDAQRVLSNARLQRISALSSYHRARVALKRLVGGYADVAAQ